MNDDLHPLLGRQLRAHFGPGQGWPEELPGLLSKVSEAYEGFESDYALLERSLELSSQELVQANSEMRVVIQAFPDVFLWLTPDGTIVSCRALNAEDLLHPARELIGRRIQQLPDSKGRTAFNQALLELNAGASHAVVEYSLVVRGSPRSFEARLLPLRADQILAIVRNITERKSSEHQLRESENRYRLLFEANPQPMWVFDLETRRFLAVNEACLALYGYSRDEFGVMRLEEIRPPEDRVQFIAHLSRIGRQFNRTGEWTHQRKNGSLLTVRVTSHTLPFMGREAALAQIEDITERRHLEAQLLQSQKMDAIGRLAGGLAHDFNNLLTTISGHGQMLARKTAEEEPRRHLTAILQASERAAALTKQLLAFSRKQVVTPVVLDFNAVVQEVRSMLATLIGEDIILELDLSPQVGNILADRVQIEQILLNLAANARDAVRRGGVVRIQTHRLAADASHDSDRICLRFADTGVGMDAATQARIFEPFYTTKAIGKGTGLGLATVYGIVHQWQGDITVESDLGRGTTFLVTFPVHRAAVACERQSDMDTPAASGSETILVVEDEELVRRFIRFLLEDHGYTVIEARNGLEAIEKARTTERCDLIVSDVVMPRLDGRAAVEAIRQLRPDVPVLMMSGYTDDEILSRGGTSLPFEILEKPFAPDVLLAKVRRLLDRDNQAAA